MRELADAWARVWGCDGVGIVLVEGDGRWALDLDDCLLSSGHWAPHALDLCARLAGCYVEVSPSGRGLHILGCGDLPPHSTRDRAGLHVELYSRLRFVTVTGTGSTGDMDREVAPDILHTLVNTYFTSATEISAGDADWREGPVEQWSGPTDDEDLIAKLLRMPASAGAAFGGKATFAQLWGADAEALGRIWPDAQRSYDCSRADAALAAHLAWATGSDCERMLRLMQHSGLARDKWEMRPDYLRATVSREAGRCTRWMTSAPALAPSSAPVASGGLLGALGAGVSVPATLTNVRDALAVVSLRWDEFTGRIIYEGKPLQDGDYINLRAALMDRGFKPITREVMRDAVSLVAEQHRYDSLIDWAGSLVWDGTPRIDAFCERYLGVSATPYSQAVGRYLWTALAGRAMQPGCRADMALCLLGAQGAGKTEITKSVAPTLDAHGELDLGRIDHADVSRQMRGKVVLEMAEMRGLSVKDVETRKAFITRTHEKWVEKYQTQESTFARRCVFIGTGNVPEILDDPTGERRWLPVTVGVMDAEAAARDRDQLWAEGVTAWHQSGVAWRDARDLARAEHEAYKVHDEWASILASWLAVTPPSAPGQAPLLPPRQRPGGITLAEAASGALGISADRLDRKIQQRIGSCLRSIGWDRKFIWFEGRTARRWLPLTDLTLPLP